MSTASSSAERTGSGRGTGGQRRSGTSSSSSQSSTSTARRSRSGTSRTQTASTTGSSSTSTPEAGTAPSVQTTAHGAQVNLPFVTAEFRKPDVHLPGREELASASETVRSQLPDTKHALFYGGLAAGTVLSLIEWPVALAIGIGTAVVSSGHEKS